MAEKPEEFNKPLSEFIIQQKLDSKTTFKNKVSA